MLSDSDFTDVVGQFPSIEFGFAYGSGVVRQDGYDYGNSSRGRLAGGVIDKENKETEEKELPMVDMIFAVKDPLAWHTANMALNPTHYTPMTTVTPWTLSHIQDFYGANMWYNAMIAMNISNYPNRLMKYGVISRYRLLKDLHSWSTLYAAGRLMKPVRIIKTGSNNEIRNALLLNRLYAVRTSLLLMSAEFNEVQLYQTIASLSYIGDPRMLIGENPKKIINLVSPVVPQYRSLYAETLARVGREVGLRVVCKDEETTFHQNISAAARWRLILSLPIPIRKRFFMGGGSRLVAGDPPSSTAIRAALATIVAKAASTQSLKGMFTVGMAKGCTYILSKVAKRVFSMGHRGSMVTAVHA